MFTRERRERSSNLAISGLGHLGQNVLWTHLTAQCPSEALLLFYHFRNKRKAILSSSRSSMGKPRFPGSRKLGDRSQNNHNRNGFYLA